MGMLLRRHDRKADRTPTVNGKPVKARAEEEDKKTKDRESKTYSTDKVR